MAAVAADQVATLGESGRIACVIRVWRRITIVMAFFLLRSVRNDTDTRSRMWQGHSIELI